MESTKEKQRGSHPNGQNVSLEKRLCSRLDLVASVVSYALMGINHFTA